jgi:hypothetical protein
MNDQLTDITIVLDRSGSMESIADDTKGGFDQFVKDQQDAPGACVLTLVQFDTEYEFVHTAKPIADVPPLEFHPRGSTALLDAFGRAIAETGERIEKMAESERPGKVLFVVITDGHENASREFTKSAIAEKVKHQSEKYGWQFVFLGANMDAIAEGAGYGVARATSATFAPSGQCVAALYAATSRNVRSYRSSGKSADLEYTDTDRANVSK